MLKSQANKVATNESSSTAEPTPEQVYAWYVKFIEKTTEGMSAVLTSEERRSQLRKVNVPLAFPAFVDRLNSMNADQRTRFVSKMCAGYEGAKAVWVGRVRGGMVERIKSRIMGSPPEEAEKASQEPTEEADIPTEE